jgi:hypothetical protein
LEPDLRRTGVYIKIALFYMWLCLLFQFAFKISTYLDHKSHYELVILYEDLVSDAEATCRNIFRVCGYDESYIPEAVKTMEQDSQGGAIVKRTTRLELFIYIYK